MSKRYLSLIGGAVLVLLVVIIGASKTNLKNLSKDANTGAAIAAKINAETLARQSARTSELNTHKTLIKNQNTNVRHALDFYRNGTPDKKAVAKSELEKNLKLRKKTISEQIKTDPEAVLATAFSTGELVNLPPDLQSLVESRQEISGSLGIYHVDTNSEAKNADPSSYHYVVIDSTGKNTELHFTGQSAELENLTSGIKVKAKGVFLDKDMALSPMGLLPTVLGASTDGQEVLGLSTGPLNSGGALANRNVLVILANFQDGTQYTTTDKTTLSNNMFGASPNRSMKELYKENSYNKITINGVVAGPITIPYNLSAMSGTLNCGMTGPGALGTTVLNAALNQGVSTAGYNNVAVVIPSSCASGLGWVGLPLNPDPNSYFPTVMINGTNFSTNMQAVAHELGHNMGFLHAHAPVGCDLDTYGKQNCSWAYTIEAEYGDRFSFMGFPLGGSFTNFVPHVNAWEKDIAGWLNYGTAPTTAPITGSGTYTIDKYESGTGVKALTYVSPNNPSVTYYLEYRTGEGFDSGVNSGTTLTINGVLVHSIRGGNVPLDPGTKFNINGQTEPNKFYLRSGPNLIDTHPNVSAPGNMADASLHIGNTFTDPFSATTFTVTSETATSATVQVSVALGCSRAPSVSVANPYQNLALGQVNFPNTITVTNNDVAGCPNDSVFNISPMTDSGKRDGTQYFSVPSAFTLVLDPGETSAPISIPSTFLGGSPSVPIDIGMWVENVTNPGLFNSVKYKLFETNDLTPPTIGNVGLWNLSSNSVDVKWNTFDDVSTSQVFYGTSSGNLTSFTTVDPIDFVQSHTVSLLGLLPNTQYYFKVKSVNPAGLFSESTQSGFQTTNGVLDTTNPAVSLTSPTGGTISGAIQVVGTATDANGITSVTLYDGTNPIGAMNSTGGTTYTYSLNTSTLSNGTHTLHMTATDPSTNVGTSNSVSVTVNNDTTAPTISAISTSAVTSTTATIGWSTLNEVSTTLVEYGTTTGYGSSATIAGLSTTHSVNLTNLSLGTTYHYRVTSADAVGNSATSSDQTFVTTGGVATSIVVSTPFYNGTTATVVSGTVTLTSTVTGTGIASVKYYKNNVNTLVGTGGPAPTYAYNWDTTLKPNNTFNIIARGYASDGVTVLATSPINKIKVVNTVVDTGAPTVPTGFLSSTKTSTSITLVWNPSSDTGGGVVSGYQIFKNGIQAASTGGATYTFTGLTPNTSYGFTIRAYDDAPAPGPNYSNQTSPTLNVTTNPAIVYQCSDGLDNDSDGFIDYLSDSGCTSSADNDEFNDITAPTIPTSLAVLSKTSTSVSLTWAASSDNVGVTGYQVFKDGILLATTTSASYTATGLTANTAYSFSVKAYDAVPNYSGASTSLSVTTNPVSSNNAPVVFPGGGDNTIPMNAGGKYMYNATVTDSDGPAPLTILWTQRSGPGTVAWTNPAQPQSPVSFSQAGTYVMRLTATDGAGASAYAETTWYVTP